MARGLLAGVAIAVALGVVDSAAGQVAIIRTAAVAHRHVVLGLSVNDLRPVQLTVAKRRAVAADGALLQQNVRLRETIQLSPSASGVVRWVSPKALRRGTYFVQVMAVETGGVTDCLPKLPNCNELWSNVRRVIVPK
jgi:hypothetical protein